jgi:REP element-mobilizing transposase RayT
MIGALRFADRSEWSYTYAYVLMPDHLHWLFALGSAKSLSRLVQSVKRYSSGRLARERLAEVPVWQAGFFDHAIRADEDLVTVSRYIVANPLRAGICAEIGHYPHWDAVWLGEDMPDR